MNSHTDQARARDPNADHAAPGVQQGLDEHDEQAEVGAMTATSLGQVQMRGDGSNSGEREGDPRAAARAGVAGPGGAMPHLDTLQSAFGDHDLSGVRAHVGGEAGEAARDIGAEAYATGSDVAFQEEPDLHTAAHEAAHVVQQQAGVQLKGGFGRSGDALEQEADQVGDAVVAGRSAAPILGHYSPLGAAPASAGGVQMKKEKDPDMSFVGSDEGAANSMQGPDDTEYTKPAEGGYARIVQGATPQFAGEMAEAAAGLRMQPVAPVTKGLDKALTVAVWDRDYYKREKPWGAGRSTNKIWDDRISYADGKATQYAEDKREVQANYNSYNSFTSLGNSLVQQLLRVEAQKMILGISSDEKMTEALIDGLGDAGKVGARAQKAYDKNKDDEQVTAPKGSGGVDAAAEKVQTASSHLDGAYIDFQQNVLQDEVAGIKATGAADEARLADINEVKDFIKNVGATIDFTQSLVSSAPEKIANAISDPASVLPGAEDALGAITDFIYYEEVTKIERHLENIQGKIEKKKLVMEFAASSARLKKYKAALAAFARAARDLQRALHDRRTEYRELGTKLDRFAQSDPASRKEGNAPAAGGDRFATMMTLVIELRQAVALARFVKEGMPALEGSKGGDSKSREWGDWAQGQQDSRGLAQYVPHHLSTPVRMESDEYASLSKVYKHLETSDGICNATVDRYGGVDAAADKLMASLGGMKGV